MVIHRCTRCKKDFYYISNYKRHTNRKNICEIYGSNIRYCNKCGIKFNSKHLLNNHLKSNVICIRKNNDNIEILSDELNKTRKELEESNRKVANFKLKDRVKNLIQTVENQNSIIKNLRGGSKIVDLSKTNVYGQESTSHIPDDEIESIIVRS